MKLIDADALMEAIEIRMKSKEDDFKAVSELRAMNRYIAQVSPVKKQDNEWIPVEERLPTENEYRAICSAHRRKPFLRRLEIAYITDTTEYQFGYYDGYKWIDKQNKEIPNVAAWKIHEPFNPLN